MTKTSTLLAVLSRFSVIRRLPGRRFLYLIIASLLALCLLLAPKASATPQSSEVYLQTLIQKATTQKLAEHKYWLSLLHYESDHHSSSEVFSSHFFLAPEGASNPEAELQATLKAFVFEKENLTPASSILELSAQCRFVARFAWLHEKLQFDPEELSFHQCPNYHKWAEQIRPESLSLIFPSYFLNGPASMYGHTLLRINRKGLPRNSLLNYAVNYAAVIDMEQESIVGYMFKGLFGFYQGAFLFAPYYLKVQEYNNFEDRDIWEYDLDLTPQEIQRMVMHIWELNEVTFPYYYFKKNCAYHLLSLLEIARPSLDLRSRYLWKTLPAETVHDLYELEHIITAKHLRPSIKSQLTQRYQQLNIEQRHTLDQVLADAPNWEALLSKMEAHERVAVLDTLIDYYSSLKTENDFLYQKWMNLVRMRSQIPLNSPPLPPTSDVEPPEEGHRVNRLSWGKGHLEGISSFLQLEYQPVLHDFMASDKGYLEYSHLDMGQTRIRYYEEQEQWVLERFMIFDTQSLTPWSKFHRTPTWQISLGFHSQEQGSCFSCLYFSIHGSIGYSLEYKGLLAYANLHLDIREGSQAFQGFAYGPAYGMLYQLHHRLKLRINRQYWQQRQIVLERSQLQASLTLHADLDLRFSLQETSHQQEQFISINWFF